MALLETASVLLTAVATAFLVAVTWQLVLVTRASVRVAEASVDVQAKIGVIHKSQAAMHHALKVQEQRVWLAKMRKDAEFPAQKRAIERLSRLLDEHTRKTMDALIDELEPDAAEDAREQVRLIEAHARAVRRLYEKKLDD